MEAITQALELAVGHHVAGRFEQAEQIYRQILAVDPNQADALHLLGVAASQLGKHELAVEYISRAIEVNGAEAAFHSNLGNALKFLGQLDGAVTAYRRALELQPHDAGSHYNLGAALHDQGKLEEAASAYRRALDLKPDFADAHYNLGKALQAQRKLAEAGQCFRRAVELKPDYAVAHYNLGATLQGQGKVDEAAVCFQRALELRSDLHEAHFSLGNAFQTRGKLDEAVACFQRALELKPHLAEAHNNLGVAFSKLGMSQEAANSFSRALELKPDIELAHSNLGAALHALGKLKEAVDSHRRALKLAPDDAESHSNLGSAFKAQGKLDDAVAAYRRALALKPDFADAWGNLLLTLQYRDGVTLSEVFLAHADYERLQAAPLRSGWRRHENDCDPDRRLRIGFVSPDLGQHPVGYFSIRALENLERGQCEIVCYSDRIHKDRLTTRFEAAATEWHWVRGLSDQELAEKIRADRIDILFDLSGHTAGNRMLLFARKPAPIQVTWAGYVGTTGLAAMDYILADGYEIPPGTDVHYCERVLRMPNGYVTYDPPPNAPEVSPLPALREGFVTFGSFNNPAKITSQVVAVWAMILDRVPRSRLLLKNRGMDDPTVADRLGSEFAGHGIDPRRVECLGWSPHSALLREYGRIDLALDPFPYNGGLTTCEALWMGVPVIICPGETFASRHSLSHLSNVGLTETIARDFDEYVELAVALANDLPRLASLRGGLRALVAASPLCDGKRFAENLMQILRDIWRRWCDQASG